MIRTWNQHRLPLPTSLPSEARYTLHLVAGGLPMSSRLETFDAKIDELELLSIFVVKDRRV